jgi:uncharacterized membrane protein
MAMARALKARSRIAPARPATRAKPATSAAKPASAAARVAPIDALRGIALCMMFAYHFSFDLRYYRVLNADFEHDPFWLGFRAVIVSSFLLLVGVSLVLAERSGMAWPRFLKRVGWIAAGALAATAASFALFPASFIYFGVLHSIAVTSLLAWPVRRRPAVALAIGIVVLVLGLTVSASVFDTRALSWIGFTTHKPVTQDYVPLAPWAGLVFVGIALGHALAASAFRGVAFLRAAPGWLRWLGRHSLVVYLVHQPIFFALLWLVLGH